MDSLNQIQTWFILMMWILILFCACDKSSDEPIGLSEELHRINIDLGTTIPVHTFDVISPIRYHRLDTSHLLNSTSTSRILRSFNQFAFLQNAPGSSDFVLFDSLGRFIHAVDGLHGGPKNFAHACDVAAIFDKNRYDILVRNPTRIVSVSSDGSKMKEKVLPFSETYFDFYYNDGEYLFFSDNILTLGEPNLRLTDDQFQLISYFDPLDPIQVQTNTMNRDKLNYDSENDQYLYKPSLIYDSIYTIKQGSYQPFGVVEKTSAFSQKELRQIEQSGAPFLKYKELYKKYADQFPIMNLYVSGDYLIIPYGSSYLVIYDLDKQKTVTFKITSDEMKIYNMQKNSGHFFITRSAFQILENAQKVHQQYDQYPNKVVQYLDYAKDVDANDNLVIIDFEWERDFIDSYFK